MFLFNIWAINGVEIFWNLQKCTLKHGIKNTVYSIYCKTISAAHSGMMAYTGVVALRENAVIV